jgi:RNA polymerase sigma-70 factor (ECF subfamily)
MNDEMPADPACRETESRRCLIACIELHVESLLGSIGLYTRRMGLDAGADARGLAVDILQETVSEALAHADRFTATRQSLAWLRGIAVNVIRRKKAEQAKYVRHEVSLSQLTTRQSLPGSEQDLLDTLMLSSATTADPGLTMESEEEVAIILSLVSPADQEVVRLAVLEDCEQETLARRLGISGGTARMRLHRALRRLRSAWVKHQKPEGKGASHEETT